MTGQFTRRQFTAGAAAALMGTSAGASAFGQAKASGRVVVGTWGGDYQNLQQVNVADPLMKPMGIEAVFDTANDTVRKTKLLAEKPLPRGSMDVVALTGQGSFEMFKNGTLEEIDEAKVPNLKHVPAALRIPYGIPHIFTGRVILYNPKIITQKPASYADLWKPEYAGKVGVIDIQYQTTLESAALIAGGGLSDYEPGKAKLMELKKLGVKIYPTNEAMAQALKSEECAICIMWHARGVMWQNAGIPIEIATPKEGVVLYMSTMSVAKNARNKDAAYAYLNALLDPAPQAKFAEMMGYAPTVDNVTLDAKLAARVTYTPEQQAAFLKQDHEYLSANDAGFQEWWNKTFKG